MSRTVRPVTVGLLRDKVYTPLCTQGSGRVSSRGISIRLFMMGTTGLEARWMYTAERRGPTLCLEAAGVGGGHTEGKKTRHRRTLLQF